MKCCCFGFESASQMAGSRGFGLFTVAAESGEPQFVLQHRALDPAATSPSTAHPVSIVSDTVIQFCPWCGEVEGMVRQCMEKIRASGPQGEDLERDATIMIRGVEAHYSAL